MQEVLDRALREAETLAGAGFQGLMVENYGDAPFFPASVPPETVAAMGLVAAAVGGAVSVPVGVNILRNDARSALGVAAASGARFMRVNVHTGAMFTDQGLLEGRAHETLRVREALGAPVSILADVLVKHATPPPGATLESAAADTWHRGGADGLILTGPATGEALDPGELDRIRTALPGEAKLWVGSGVTSDTVRELLDQADGIIVGSTLQAGGRAGSGVEEDRVRIFMDALRRG
jgi:membrane complex biogenesis BtpA family protein